MMPPKMRKWFVWGLINLAIVALYGLLMRYKIAFSLPFLEQKNLLHAHSHFAFSGWISQMLYAALALQLSRHLPANKVQKYHWLLALNLVCSFGMLVSFTIQAYKAVSIFFSTAAILVSVIYLIAFLKDKAYLPATHPSRSWWQAGLLFNILSALGPFTLAYMMATQSIHQWLYLGSVYFYLHFQYNGWFFFGLLAIVVSNKPDAAGSVDRYFKILCATVIPTFLLSILWVQLPLWLYIPAVAATVAQLAAWVHLLIKVRQSAGRMKDHNGRHWSRWFSYAATAALTLKLLLQGVSVLPGLSQLVFGFRPIVIAYLHLVLLGVYSLYLVGFMFVQQVIVVTPFAKVAGIGFLAAVLFNELLLAVQGMAAFYYRAIPYINESLFSAALLLFITAAGLALAALYPRFRRNGCGSAGTDLLPGSRY